MLCREVDPLWLRVGGTLAALFGVYYLGAAHGEVSGSGLHSFYTATVIGRLALASIFILLHVQAQAGVGLLVLAAVNTAGAVTMARALRSS